MNALSQEFQADVRQQQCRRFHLRSGQTLIIALFILGVLLILTTVFLGFVSRGITSAQRGQQRSVATDLAEAGVRYAHAQLMDSELGADWRPPLAINANPRDPDFEYLRVGGPDGLGAYSRIDMSQGRVLIRVRYAPSDANIFSGSPTGNLRTPGRARGYLILESVGRSGQFNQNDPTTVTGREKAQERKVIAFASIGIIDQARFITNKFNVSRPAELGIPADMGAVYGTIPVNTVPLQMGNAGTLYIPQVGSNTSVPTLTPIPYGGGLRVNGDLTVFGTVEANINTWLGDQWLVSGNITGADNNSQLRATITDLVLNAGAYNYQTATKIFINNAATDPLNSRSPNFDTENFLRDGFSIVDDAGRPRGARRLEPPSILRRDPQTGLTRYVQMTRESGSNGPAGNDGRFGYGRGIYVDNQTDRQIRPDEGGRADLGTAESLVYDWLNPNNGNANTGWRGPFYVPTGAFLELKSDGFVIQRNSQSIDPNVRTWKLPDGTDTGSTLIQYRVGKVNGQAYIVNSFTPGVNINGNLTTTDFAKGQPFNGVLYFEGNVRVRGVIPTDIQITVVSGATIYIEGSITKGVLGNDYTGNVNQVLTRPSLSMAMFMAKEYVALNTSQFVGVGAGQTLDVKDGDALSSLRMSAASGSISLKSEWLLNPDSNLITGSTAQAANPASWDPYSTSYAMEPQSSPGSRKPVPQNLLLTHGMDDSGGAAPATFVSLDVNFGLDNPSTTHGTDWNYLFPLEKPYNFNSALAYQGNNWQEYPSGPLVHSKGFSIVEGLGDQPWQKFPKFESQSFDLIDNTFSYSVARFDLEGPDAGDESTRTADAFSRRGFQGSFVGLLQATNDLSIRPNNQFGVATADYLLARAAIVPLDVRVEASVYAEEGSFFVIPGRSYNTNPNDRRDLYDAAVQAAVSGGMSLAQARDAADLQRLTDFGAFPATPFYGEPLDIKVSVLGSVSENMPPPMSQQSEWLKRWAWIPRKQGGARTTIGNGGTPVDLEIPVQHIPGAQPSDPRYTNYVPNVVIAYDPALAGGRVFGFDTTYGYIRTDGAGRPLPPLPRLPVSSTLSYFGEVNP